MTSIKKIKDQSATTPRYTTWRKIDQRRWCRNRAKSESSTTEHLIRQTVLQNIAAKISNNRHACPNYDGFYLVSVKHKSARLFWNLIHGFLVLLEEVVFLLHFRKATKIFQQINLNELMAHFRDF